MENGIIRDSFVFYRSFYEAITELPNENQLEIYKTIIEYALNGTTNGSLNGINKSIFSLIKPQIDSNNQKYLNGSKPKRKQHQSEKEAKHKQVTSKTRTNVNDNVNDNGNVNVNENEAKRFKSPLMQGYKEGFDYD